MIRNSIAWPANDDVGLAEAERLAGGDPELGRHEVDPGPHLRHRVLDLDPAVDLDEVEVGVPVHQELEGAEVLVPGGHDGPDRPLRELLAGGLRQRRCRRLLDQLLVATLDRAVALAEVDAVAVAVDHDLDLDVAVVLQPLLEVERVVAEGGAGLGPADLEGGLAARGACGPSASPCRRRRPTA